MIQSEGGGQTSLYVFFTVYETIILKGDLGVDGRLTDAGQSVSVGSIFR